MSVPPNDFSSRLDLALSTAGMTRGDLAAACGVSPSTVSRWRGKHTPSPVLLGMAANALKVRREWLVAGTDPMRPAPLDDIVDFTAELPLREDTPSYQTNKKLPASKSIYLSLMIAILQEVLSGKRPVADLDEVHALLDLAHPMQQKPD